MQPQPKRVFGTQQIGPVRIPALLTGRYPPLTLNPKKTWPENVLLHMQGGNGNEFSTSLLRLCLKTVKWALVRPLVNPWVLHLTCLVLRGHSIVSCKVLTRSMQMPPVRCRKVRISCSVPQKNDFCLPAPFLWKCGQIICGAAQWKL